MGEVWQTGLTPEQVDLVEQGARGCGRSPSAFSAAMKEVFNPTPKGPEPFPYDGELYGADPSCKHEVVAKSMQEGGGVKCRKCPGWFCY